MAQQGQLHGEAQPVGGAAPACHEILVGPGEGVMSRQSIGVDRDTEQQPALFARRAMVGAPSSPPPFVPEMPIRIVDTAGLMDVFCGRKCRDRKTAPRRCPQNGRLRDAMGGILGYARVSTGDQDVAGQTMRLTEAGAIKVFSDVRSGKTMERPGLEALLAYARKGDTLSVVRLDRLGRSLGELLTTVAMLKERGIALLSLEERIDTNSAAGELVFHVFGAIAHFERRLIAERTRDGIAAARARGKRPGRHPLDPEKIAAALELVKAGLSPTVAARQLGLGRSTVYREVGRAGIAR